jgi:hypothetical protein
MENVLVSLYLVPKKVKYVETRLCGAGAGWDTEFSACSHNIF